MSKLLGIAVLCVFSTMSMSAAVYNATPADFKAAITALKPGDTLNLAAGTYSNFSVYGLNGSSSAWITIQGPTTGGVATIVATSGCCNLVEITNSSYVAIKNLTIDSKGIDGIFGISAKGGASNNTHDILIEGNTFIGQGASQATVAISTKSPTWRWVIRRNRIIGAGTGMYLGNSDGTMPFIAGLIENNLIKDTIGYNIEVKWQQPRPVVANMPATPQSTIIRNNVFIKNDQISPAGDRPNLLVGGFPESGPGSTDLYEIYGNFFYHNPREALFQGSGRVSLHDNVFVDGAAGAIVMVDHDLPLKLAYVYNNTIYTSGRGIRFGSTARSGDRVIGNLVFADTPISGAIVNQSANIVDTRSAAPSYVKSPSFVLASMDFYPLPGKARGAALDLSAFSTQSDFMKDFNGTRKDAAGAVVFRGAYAGEGTNPGWKLQGDIKSAGSSATPGTVGSIWQTAAPTDPWRSDNPVTLGVKFRSDVAGSITGIRFWKDSPSDSKPHIGLLYSSIGGKLAEATFTSETTSGWQQVNFLSPVSVAANTTYIAAYFSSSGWSADGSYFLGKGADAPPLHALASGVDGPNGLYSYSSTPQFPTASYGANYWVDVVFTPGAPATSSGTAAFLGLDTATAGSWRGVYGSDGFNVIGNIAAHPAYATVTGSGYSTYQWAASTTVTRAMQKAGSAADRIAACWYSSSSFQLDVAFTDSAVHQVAIYLLDWDTYAGGRSEKVEVLDASGAVLDSRVVSGFSNGQYLVWNLSGRVKIRFTNTNPSSNAVVSGIFFGGSGAAATSTAAFVRTDTTTAGNWRSVYGTAGYNVIGNQASYPAYASVAPASGSSLYTWAASSTDVRALQKVAPSTDRAAACWYSSSSFQFDLAFTDSAVHQVAIYVLDWDSFGGGRSEKVDILDANGAVLDSRAVSEFRGGQYLVWNLTGRVRIRITNANPSANAVLSGVFFQ